MIKPLKSKWSRAIPSGTSDGEKAKRTHKNRQPRKPGKVYMAKMAAEAPQQEKPLIIPIFIMNAGCPQHCIFCNEKIAAGNFAPEVIKSFFEGEVASYLRWNKDKFKRVEIAFYGGSFTGLAPDYQKRLLTWANAYIRQGQVESIRISTRPDYINDD